MVPLNVLVDFGDPIVSVVSAGELFESLLQIPSVPKVAITEDDYALLHEYDIWTTGKPRVVESIAETAPPKLTPKHQFAARINLSTRAPRGGGCFGRSWPSSDEGGA